MSSPSSNPGPTGARKRKAPINDNGEPVVLAKKKVVGPRASKKQKLETITASTTMVPQKPTLVKKSGTSSAKPQASRHPSVEIEEILDERDSPRSFPPRNPKHILELDDDEENDPPSPAMDVEDDEDKDDKSEEAEEDDEAEIGLFSMVCKETKLKHH
jgi:hypothetical protein